MFNKYYQRRLEKDLPGWVDRGWVTPEGSAAIRKAAAPASFANRLPIVLAFLGAVLLGFAAMTFVAANWQEIPRLARLTLLLAAMVAAYAAAYPLARRGHDFVADAAVLVGVGMYGATIMLVGQMYHLPANFSGGVLLWSLGALIAGVLAQARGALAVAFAGFVLWSGYGMFEHDVINWLFLPLWVIALICVERRDWQAGRHLAIIALSVWIALFIITLSENYHWATTASLAVGLAAFAILWSLAHVFMSLQSWLHRIADLGGVLRPYATAGFLTLLISYQFDWHFAFRSSGTIFPFELPGLVGIAAAGGVVTGTVAYAARRAGALRTADLICITAVAGVPLLLWPLGLLSWAPKFTVDVFLALFALAAAIWTIEYGQTQEHRASIGLGLTAFGAEVLYIYFETFGTLLDTALFFLVGGILLIVLAVVFTRLHRRLRPASGAVQASQEAGS